MNTYRIGIATSDGIVVNQHFGKASSFLVVDVDEAGELHRVETREVKPVCMGGEHDDQRLEENVKILSDCRYLLVSRIGNGALGVLERQGISVFEMPDIIEESVRKMLAYIEIQKLLF